jgi:hypothetical protein
MGSEAKWSDVNIFVGMSVLSWIYSDVVCMWCTVHCFLLLSHCLIAICFMFVALFHILILFNLFVLCLFSSFVCFAFYFVLGVFCIVSPHVYSCLFPICVQLYRSLPLGGNPIAVNKYHIISNDTAHWPGPCHYIGRFRSKNELYS